MVRSGSGHDSRQPPVTLMVRKLTIFPVIEDSPGRNCTVGEAIGPVICDLELLPLAACDERYAIEVAEDRPGDWEEECERIHPDYPEVIYEGDRHLVQIETKAEGKVKITVRSVP